MTAPLPHRGASTCHQGHETTPASLSAISAMDSKASRSQAAFQTRPASDRGRFTWILNTTKPV